MVKKQSHNTHYFSIELSYSECEDLYQQHIKYLLVQDTRGKRIQLPKDNMRKFITPQGLRGQFELKVDQNHKLVSITLLR